MQYLGGKFYLAKWIAAEAEKFAPGLPVWEPFCGGLSVSVAFAKAGRAGVASDRHPALIALYKAVADGWDPPKILTEADYAHAKTLPNTDPLKAFAGFGCSFGGKYFGGYARPKNGVEFYCNFARNVLLRDVPFLVRAGWSFDCLDFLVQEVSLGSGLLIYCDPPYAGTTGYGGTFDHAAFWAKCSLWARAGARVLVSEYSGHGQMIAERTHNLHVTGTTGSQKNARTERLFAL